MRASSLSSQKVIDLLNRCYVPVHLRNQDHGETGKVSAEEKSAKEKIYRQALAGGLHAGTVCAYLVSPDGRTVATAPANESLLYDPDRLAELLEQVAKELKTSPGDRLLAPKRAVPPAAPNDLVLHLVARYLERRGDQVAPYSLSESLGTKKGIGWASLPSEVFVVLTRAEWTKLLPPGDVRPGSTWRLDEAVAAKVLTHFFPPTENTDLKKNRIDELVLEARVASVDAGTSAAQLSGRLKMKHPFYHKDDNNFVEAALIGWIAWDRDRSTVRAFQLVTENGQYGGSVNGVQPFGAAVRIERSPE